MNYKFDEESSRTCSRWDKVIVLFKSSPWHPFVVDPQRCTLLEHDTVGCIGGVKGMACRPTQRSLVVRIFDQPTIRGST